MATSARHRPSPEFCEAFAQELNRRLQRRAWRARPRPIDSAPPPRFLWAHDQDHPRLLGEDHRRQGQAASPTTRGSVALIVNVASQCGLTPQYKGLEELHETYGAAGASRCWASPPTSSARRSPGTDGADRGLLHDELRRQVRHVLQGEGQGRRASTRSSRSSRAPRRTRSSRGTSSGTSTSSSSARTGRCSRASSRRSSRPAPTSRRPSRRPSPPADRWKTLAPRVSLHPCAGPVWQSSRCSSAAARRRPRAPRRRRLTPSSPRPSAATRARLRPRPTAPRRPSPSRSPPPWSRARTAPTATSVARGDGWRCRSGPRRAWSPSSPRS